VFHTLARGVDVYKRYLVVGAILACAAILGGLILRQMSARDTQGGYTGSTQA
jgi:hypothetical protein